MSAEWHFRSFRPGDRARNSQVEKFFRSDVVEDEANALVREGIQNSLDAAVPEEKSGKKSIIINIAFGEIAARSVRPYVGGLFEHLEAVRDKFPNVPDSGEPVRFLAFEDFNTAGLTGDPEEWEPPEAENAFFSFFRGEGVSNKKGRQKGRHGVGKMVFSVASRARAIFGITATADAAPMLMGTSTLKQHRVKQRSFHPDGWFGNCKVVDGCDLVVPVTDPAYLGAFTQLFGLDRDVIPGLSIVVPWIVESITPEIVTHATVKGFFWPILEGRLCVDIRSASGTLTRLDSERLPPVANSLSPQFESEKADINATLDLARWAQTQDPAAILTASTPEGNAQEWKNSLLTDEQITSLRETLAKGLPAALCLRINIRKKGSKTVLPSEMRIFLSPDPSCRDGNVQFIRDGLLISGVRCRRCPGYRALVVIENGPLASFLGDAENPSHTEWQKENVRDQYLFHDSCLRFVTQSVPNVLKALHDDQPTADPTLLLDLFQLPGADDAWPPTKNSAKKRKDGGRNEPPDSPPPPKKPRHSVQQTEDGFIIRRGHPEAERPRSIRVTAGYGVRRGNPFTRYQPSDFDLSKKPMRVEYRACRELSRSGNFLNVEIQGDEFEIDVKGFDTNRDVFLDIELDQESPEDSDGTPT